MLILQNLNFRISFKYITINNRRYEATYLRVRMWVVNNSLVRKRAGKVL